MSPGSCPELATMEDELLMNKEDIVDPMIGFLGGQQRQIYDKAKAFVDGNQANFDVAGADLADELRYSWSGVVFQRKCHAICGLEAGRA